MFNMSVSAACSAPVKQARPYWETAKTMPKPRTCHEDIQAVVKNPAASCGASSIPKEEEVYSRLLTPKQASGNAQTLGFIH
jgi:hypothetical protein